MPSSTPDKWQGVGGWPIVTRYRKHLPMQFCHFCWSPLATIPRSPGIEGEDEGNRIR